MAEKDHGEERNDRGLSEEESEAVGQKLPLRAPVVYEIVREEGEEEIRRPPISLWWSGIAAGLSIGFSLLSEALLRHYLPDAPWRPLVANMGYSVGFIMVILGRQQLFTENTITPILPLFADFDWWTLGRVARLWAIVFAANMLGTFGFALFNSLVPGTIPEIMHAMLEISREALAKDWFEMFARAIGAGFLIATIVWLIPSAKTSKIHVVFLFTYILALAEFTHIVAGSTEAFLLVLAGELGILEMLWRFTVPVFLGNVIGGTALFALIAYGQVMREIRE